MMKGISGAGVLCLWAATVQSGPISLGFEGHGEGAAPTEMTEDGFRIVTRDAMISGPGKSGDGTDGPNEIESVMGGHGSVAILRDVPFSFVSLDWQSEGGAPRVVAEGYLGPQLIARDHFTSPGPQAGYVTFAADTLAGQVIDRLILTPQRDRAGMGALDRVILDEVPQGAPST